MLKKMFLLAFLLNSMSFIAQTSPIDTLYVSPNPCDTATTINFTISQTDTVSLSVYNIWGAQVKSFFQNIILSAGSYIINYNTDSLDTGTVYFVILKVDTFRLGYKLFKSTTALNTNHLQLKRQIRVYPNPFLNDVNMNSDVEKSVILRDLYGKLVYENNHVKGVINLSGISVGTYLLTLYNEKGQILLHQKIIK
jgi:Secretion system C-terminal sorting domain